ncbi:hypothetical protein AAFF_G00392820 [Aldrovandia affinis]|uniref:Uncharacterized protein n=1 Tax=Aldrovandia affinis TaxID=143900 RepID=A0AAD7R3W6_9TELE|nr:hypothetical protein AAFF_G00392820 [Aldrovandia affinis]
MDDVESLLPGGEHWVPLVIFKREKELARKLEFDGHYVTEQPEDDDIKGQWDRLVLNTPVLQRLLENRLFIKPEKCEFHCQTTTFLGYIISAGSLQMDPQKIRAVLDWPRPLTLDPNTAFRDLRLSEGNRERTLLSWSTCHQANLMSYKSTDFERRALGVEGSGVADMETGCVSSHHTSK